MAYKQPNKKPYRIYYGKSVYYKSAKRGKTFHVSRPLNKKETEEKLKELNKKYDYTTVTKDGKYIL